MQRPHGISDRRWKQWRDWWYHPWTKRARARRNIRFRRWLARQGRLTPNFTYGEYRSHDGQRLPRRMVRKARQHCWQLERFRHAVGDKSMPILSGYRSPEHNAAIHGASQSRHMSGDATDFDKATVDAIGHDRFFDVAEVIFPNDGVGEYPSGSAHLDSRGWRARWTTF